ncbi:MAG: hypothetical protein N2593_02935 [Patescibacteria group bacterium]|nr:hypothetical protein [Patescibacteria group bacterium]
MNEIKSIKLSSYTQALLSALTSIKKRSRPDDLSALNVSQTVSFFALAYEKVRNAVEFREDHLILRGAIERILRRRFSINPDGKGEAENLIRELLWARYFDNGAFGTEDIIKIQEIIDKYIFLKRKIIPGRDINTQNFLNDFLLDLLTCQIEEYLKSESAQRNANLTYFIYQVLRKKIKIEGLKEEEKDVYFLISLEKIFRRSDKAYLHHHIFIDFYKPLYSYSKEELEKIASKLPSIFEKIDKMIKSPYVDSINKFTKKQLPPFLIFFEIIKNKPEEIESILTGKEKLWIEVDETCRTKYQQMGKRITNLGIRSFIYILLTKMIFAIILEFPLSKAIYNEINYESILINTLFPPILMIIILGFFRVPGEENTKKIYQRIIEIIDEDASFETKIAFVPKKSTPKKPTLIFGFTVFYSLTFIITLSLIYEFLNKLNFNFISQAIFIFFVSVVTFFSYRISQVSKELTLSEKESIFTPIIDFFFMPILSLGKFFSSEIAKLNFFIFIFDFIIEAPFKLLFEVIEEWISFVKKRKEEII